MSAHKPASVAVPESSKFVERKFLEVLQKRKRHEGLTGEIAKELYDAVDKYEHVNLFVCLFYLAATMVILTARSACRVLLDALLEENVFSSPFAVLSFKNIFYAATNQGDNVLGSGNRPKGGANMSLYLDYMKNHCMSYNWPVWEVKTVHVVKALALWSGWGPKLCSQFFAGVVGVGLDREWMTRQLLISGEGSNRAGEGGDGGPKEEDEDREGGSRAAHASEPHPQTLHQGTQQAVPQDEGAHTTSSRLEKVPRYPTKFEIVKDEHITAIAAMLHTAVAISGGDVDSICSYLSQHGLPEVVSRYSAWYFIHITTANMALGQNEHPVVSLVTELFQRDNPDGSMDSDEQLAQGLEQVTRIARNFVKYTQQAVPVLDQVVLLADELMQDTQWTIGTVPVKICISAVYQLYHDAWYETKDAITFTPLAAVIVDMCLGNIPAVGVV